MKSRMKMERALATMASVVAWPTPLAPPEALKPLKQQIERHRQAEDGALDEALVDVHRDPTTAGCG